MLLDEIHHFVHQSNISKKNIKRLSQLETDSIQEVAELASLVKAIALLKPTKRKRWKWLWQREPQLVRSASEAGLIDFDSSDSQPFEDDYGSSAEFSFLDEEFASGDCFGVWIEPWPHEREPVFSPVLGDGIN